MLIVINIIFFIGCFWLYKRIRYNEEYENREEIKENKRSFLYVVMVMGINGIFWADIIAIASYVKTTW